MKVNECKRMNLKAFELYSDGLSYADLLQQVSVYLRTLGDPFVQSVSFWTSADDALCVTVIHEDDDDE